MKRKNRFSELLRPLGALALAGATLWTVSVTAGSATAADAWAALRQEVPLTLLRWQLGDPGLPDGLSPAAVLTLSQSPLLLSARRDIYELRRQSEETPEAEAPAPVTQPVEETPQTPEAETAAGTDNGVAAKTLIPTDPSGYTVFGRVYISNSTKYTLSSEELQKPFAAELTGEAPQVLILHTHGSEGYTPVPGTEVVWSGDCRTTDTRYNVVHMGDAIAEELGKAGISVLHDRTLYDYPEYAGAYDRALPAIEAALKQYPSIHFVLDVHRDAIEDSAGNQIKVVSDIDGVGTAAHNTGIEAGPGKGVLRRPQQLEHQLRLQQQEQSHQKAEHGAEGNGRRGDHVAVLSVPSGADVLGQQDGGGGAHGGQHDDDHVHDLVAVADGGHGGGAEAGDHELVHVAHQQLQEKLRENGQGQMKDPAGLGRKTQRHIQLLVG